MVPQTGRSKQKSPLPGKVKFLLAVGQNGLLFASAASPNSARLVRVGLTSGAALHGTENVNLRAAMAKCGSKQLQAPQWQVAVLDEEHLPGCGPGSVTAMTFVAHDKLPRLFDTDIPDDRYDGISLPLPIDIQNTGGSDREQSAATAKTSMQQRHVGTGGLRAVVSVGGARDGDSFGGDVTDGGNGADPGLCMLGYGFGLEASSCGHTGLPEGATLLAQPLRVSSQESQRQQVDGGPSQSARRERIAKSPGSDQPGGHVLLFSYRPLSQTRLMMMSPEGEIKPVSEATVRPRSNPDLTVAGSTHDVSFPVVQLTYLLPPCLLALFRGSSATPTLCILAGQSPPGSWYKPRRIA